MRGVNWISAALPAWARHEMVWSIPPPMVPTYVSALTAACATCVLDRRMLLATAVARVEATTKAEEEERPALGGTVPSTNTLMPTWLVSPSPLAAKAAL